MTGPTRSSKIPSLSSFLRHFSSSSPSPSASPSSSSVTNIPLLPPRPTIDYNRIISNRNTYAKNLVDRKSHLTRDAIEDIAYLHGELKNLSKKLTEARHRQNLLGNKIKEAISSTVTSTPTTKDLQPRFPSKEDEELLLSPGPLSKKKTNELLKSSSNLELAAKVQDYHTEAASLKDAISNLSKDGLTLEKRLLNLAIQLPNETHPSVPIGSYQHSEIVSMSSGSTHLLNGSLPFKSFQDPPRPPDPNRDHLNVMTELGWLSFAEGQKTTGPSFPFLMGNGAFLELALIQYAVFMATRAGWNLTTGPDIVRSELSDRCGFSPRDGGESNHTYFVSTNRKNHEVSSDPSTLEGLPPIPSLCLAATAEIPLVGSFHSITLPNQSYPSFPLKPIQLVSLGTAFRAEAGSRGSESRGLYRVHQFKKVELMAITDADTQISEKMLQKMLDLQIQIIEGLNLPFRILEMSSEELGASAYHKYDIEAWMPGRGRWGEVSSASNCTDYQSRRLGIRSRARPNPNPGSAESKEEEDVERDVRPKSISLEGTGPTPTAKKSPTFGEKARHVHTLNATAVAIPRLIVALIENGVILDHAKDDAHPKVAGIRLPSSLKPFWLGQASGINWVSSDPASKSKSSP